MMGLGPLGIGGSSSSSNLSASAQPFTVDRSVPKPNSNPLAHFTEAPYADPFNPPLNNWVYSHNPTSKTDFLTSHESEVDSIRANASFSSNPYRYSSSQSIHSPTTPLPSLNPAPAITDSFSYAQCSDGLAKSFVETKPYYPQYVSPVVEGDNPLGVLHEPGYDLLPTSGISSLNGSLHDDYAPNLSGLEYAAGWCGAWNGLTDGKQNKKIERNGTSSLNEKNVARSPIYKNHMKHGAHTAEGLCKREEMAAAVLDRTCIDGQGRDKCIGSLTTEEFYDKAVLGRNPKCLHVESSRTSVLVSAASFPETHSPVPSLQSVNNSSSLQKPYSALYEKSSPALVIRPPAAGINYSGSNKMSKIVNLFGNDVDDYNDDFSGHNLPNKEDPHHPLGWERNGVCLDANRLTIDMEKNDHTLFKSSVMEKKEMSNKNAVTKDAWDKVFKVRSDIHESHVNCPENLKLSVTAEAIDSAEKSSENLEYYNPAVDSPCWKGAFVSHFSPIEVSEDATPQLLIKKSEAFNISNLQGPSNFPLNADGTGNFFYQRFSDVMHPENDCVHAGSSPFSKRSLVANSSSKEHRSDDAVKEGFQNQNLSCGRVQPLGVPRTEYASPNNSRGNCDSRPLAQQLRPEEGKFTFENKLAFSRGSVDVEMNINDASQDGPMPSFNATEYVPSQPAPGENESAKLAKLKKGESNPKMNAQMLVNTIFGLSELLFVHCSNDACALKEEDLEALKHVINNINACTLKKVKQMSPKHESLFPKRDSSDFTGHLPDIRRGARDSRPQAMQDLAGNVLGELNGQYTSEDMGHYAVSEKKDEGVPLRDDTDAGLDDDMTKAIKKILHENFRDEEEKHPQAFLYKNLWLQAEAALCSISYRARFNRMKIEMRECNSRSAKGVSKNSVVEEKVSSKVSEDANMLAKLAPKTNNNPTQDALSQNSPAASTIAHVNDAEASVMARFNILKGRVDSVNTSNIEGQLLPDVSDLGFAGKENPCLLTRDQSEDGCLDMTLGSDLQNHLTNIDENLFGLPLHGSEHKTVKEFHVHVGDDQVSGTSRLGNQLLAGWYDSSSSEWEQVQEEEIA